MVAGCCRRQIVTWFAERRRRPLLTASLLRPVAVAPGLVAVPAAHGAPSIHLPTGPATLAAAQ